MVSATGKKLNILEDAGCHCCQILFCFLRSVSYSWQYLIYQKMDQQFLICQTFNGRPCPDLSLILRSNEPAFLSGQRLQKKCDLYKVSDLATKFEEWTYGWWPIFFLMLPLPRLLWFFFATESHPCEHDHCSFYHPILSTIYLERSWELYNYSSKFYCVSFLQLHM